MKLLEIKNNLVKISFQPEEPIALGSFVAMMDAGRSYVAQVVNLKADLISNYAVAKLQFTLSNDGVIDNYDGSIPSLKAGLSLLNYNEILSLLPIERPLTIGKLAQQNEILRIDQTLLEKNLVICAEKFDNINLIVNNFVGQLEQINEKSVVIDIDHTFSEFEPIRFKRDFKLPLNSKMIDFIFENELEDVSATSKATIQDIFYEVQEYVKTIEFIPFDNFLNVVSQQYQATLIPELAFLKNKLLKLQDDNIFAQTQEEIDSLRNAINEHSITYIDISEADEKLQTELIRYIHSIMSSLGNYLYLFVKLNNQVGNKKLLKQILDNDYIFANIVCGHNYKYLAELKNKAENLILFAPQTIQHDFASYNTFLNKLNANEFVIYGALTQNIPFIVELDDVSQIEELIEQPVMADLPPIKTVDEQSESISSFEFTSDDTLITAEENQSGVESESKLSFNDLAEKQKETAIAQIEQVEFLPAINFSSSSDIEPQGTIVDQLEPIHQEDELVEQVARDVDKVLYNNIIEDIPPIEEENIVQEDNLTEDDLNFIDELPQADFAENIESVETVENTEIVEEEPILSFEEQFENASMEQEEEFFGLSNDLSSEFDNYSETTSEPFDDFEIAEDVEPDLPIYPSETPILDESTASFMQGDTVTHPKYGKGVIEKLIKYGNKTLCSISFENTGKKLLDPAISELEKI